MIGVTIGFVSAGLLLLTMGLLIRSGMTWLIAGYDAKLVRDEKGLARWVGSLLMGMGAVAALAGGLFAVLPEEYLFVPLILYIIAIPGGVITILCGLRRFVK
jgi:hypothetical protein